MMEKILTDKTSEEKNSLVTQISDLVLINLEPFERNRLLTRRQEKQMRDVVSNIDESKDLYSDLGIEKGANVKEVEKAYEEKLAVLSSSTKPEDKAELEKISYAKEVLVDESRKERYDTSSIEPTVFSKVLPNNSYYIYISKISPTTFDEFVNEANKAPEGESSLILDLRGNIGGAVDYLSYILGLFIGQNQYAYDFFHQGDYTPFKTEVGKLPKISQYKKTVILTDENMQSSAETLVASLKKYNIGVLVGKPTHGHGTIENTFPINTKITENEDHSLLLVHSITMRDDGQPIEGRGVDPDISTGDANWKEELLKYYNDSNLVSEVSKLIKNKPSF